MLAGSEHTLLGLQYDKIRVLQHSEKKISIGLYVLNNNTKTPFILIHL